MLTVLMASHNGAGTLPLVLEAYRALQPPIGGYRLVVVDNASTDATAAVLREDGAGLPLQVLHCPERGKNRALNQGLTAVQGDLVVLTDDDAVPQADWLCQLDTAARSQPHHDLFGGQILPDWPGLCPDWIPRLVNLGATFAITPKGMATGQVPADRLWGPNMAVRRRVFDAGHRFNEAVGPAAGQYIMGSETEFSGRVEKAGYRAWFVADAIVAHIIRPHQIEPDWIIQRAYRLGRHMLHQDTARGGPPAVRFRGAPRWMWRQLMKEHAKAVWARVRGDADARFLADWEISFLRGYLYEAARALSSSLR